MIETSLQLVLRCLHTSCLGGALQNHAVVAVLGNLMCRRPVLRLFPPCAPSSHAQGSSGVVATVPLVWRGHTKRLTTRARPSPDLAVWLE